MAQESNQQTGIVKITLKSIYIKQLKGIRDCTITIDKPLIAIMGVNGSGKSTIIHALACSFKPVPGAYGAGDPRNKDHKRKKFFEFFPPTTHGTWKNSSFKLTIEKETNGGTETSSISYSKTVDRWTPKYDRQPFGNILYFGVNTCCPDIEKFKQQRAKFNTTECTDKVSQWVAEQASYILNKDYSCILNNDFNKTNYIGVRTSESISYSSLSMGAGEQRVIKLLEDVKRATPYSIILIDEIDLLLHSEALKRLIGVLHDAAQKQKLQFIFTTHSLIMDDLKNLVSIKFLQQDHDKTEVYNGISSLSWKTLSGDIKRPMTIYVEDNMANAIVKSIAKDLNVSGKVDVRIYGAIENAFTVAASLVLSKSNIENTLIVLDGDRYREKEQREKLIKARLTGTESDIEDKRKRALSCISQFDLPIGIAPEQHLWQLLKDSDHDNEIVNCAKRIRAVDDSHDWIRSIVEETNCSYADIIMDCKAANAEKWQAYTKNVREWIAQRVDL